jgi:hypothetical protein
LAHEDLNELLNALLPFAQEMLTKHGEFFPFGVSIAAGGERRMDRSGIAEEKRHRRQRDADDQQDDGVGNEIWEDH